MELNMSDEFGPLPTTTGRPLTMFNELPANIAASICHNEHKLVYDSVKDYTDRLQCCEWVSDEEKAKAIATDELWEVRWYPITPVGFCHWHASSLEAIADKLRQNS